MKKLFFAFVIVFSFYHAQSQNQTEKIDTTNSEPATVQEEAKFPGGPSAWKKYLENNLNISVATKYLKLKKGEKEAMQTAIVSFLVDTEGNISQVHVLNPDEVHPKLAAEAIRVIKEGPKWKPAIQYGRNVIYRQRQNITFAVTRG